MSDRVEVLKKKPDPALVARLIPLIERVVDSLDEGKDCTSDIAQINALCGGQTYTSHTFFELYSSMSTEQFASIAAKGVPPALAKLDRSEIIEIIEAILDPSESPEYFIKVMDRSLPNIWSSDLVFWPDKERSPSELADYLLNRQTERRPDRLT